MIWVWAVVGVIVLYVVIRDIWTGEYDMIRSTIQLIIIYGTILAGAVLAIEYDFRVVGWTIFAIGILLNIGSRDVGEWLLRVIPAKFDKMDIDKAIIHLKSRGIPILNIRTYLMEKRKLSAQDSYKYLTKYYSKQEIDKEYIG